MANTEEPNWGRRASDLATTVGTEKVDRAERVINFATKTIVIIAVITAAIALLIGWYTALQLREANRDIKKIAIEIKIQSEASTLAAERNTELLAVECDLQTGLPIPLPTGKPFVNTEEFLNLYCANQVNRANSISGYITQINNASRLQLDAHDENAHSHHMALDALIRGNQSATGSRRPIPAVPLASPTTTRSVPPRKVTDLPPSSAPAASPTPQTTTTCPTKGKSDKCHTPGKEKK